MDDGVSVRRPDKIRQFIHAPSAISQSHFFFFHIHEHLVLTDQFFIGRKIFVPFPEQVTLAGEWEAILELYNQLLLLNYSPSVALHHTFALYKANGRDAALAEAKKLKLENNHFYFLLLGELYKDSDNEIAKQYYQRAYDLSKTQMEKRGIQEKIDRLSRY